MRFDYTVDSHRISAIENGDRSRPRVIYIHGTPGDAENFASYVLDPVDDADSISIDRPGFGRTTPPGAVASLEAQARVIEPLLVARDGVWPVLVGHSLGGPIALRVAAEHPDRVGAVVVVAGSVDPELERVMFIQRVGEFLFVPALLPRAIRNANRELLPLRGELETLSTMLERVRCPVVIVHGTKDSLVPYSNAPWLRDQLVNSRGVWVTTIPGEDHFLVWTDTEDVRRSVSRGLREAGAKNPGR